MLLGKRSLWDDARHRNLKLVLHPGDYVAVAFHHGTEADSATSAGSAFSACPTFVSVSLARSKNWVSVGPGMRHVTVTPVSWSSLRSAGANESMKAWCRCRPPGRSPGSRPRSSRSTESGRGPRCASCRRSGARGERTRDVGVDDVAHLVEVLIEERMTEAVTRVREQGSTGRLPTARMTSSTPSIVAKSALDDRRLRAQARTYSATSSRDVSAAITRSKPFSAHDSEFGDAVDAPVTMASGLTAGGVCVAMIGYRVSESIADADEQFFLQSPHSAVLDQIELEPAHAAKGEHLRRDLQFGARAQVHEAVGGTKGQESGA